MVDDQPGVQLGKRGAKWKRLLLIGFSAGAGIVITVVASFGIVQWYQNRPVRTKKEWRPLHLSDKKIKGMLHTEWRDGALKYKFFIEPDDKTLAEAFDRIVRNGHVGDLISANVDLRDAAGFALCKVNISGLSRVSASTGTIAALETEGEDHGCSRAEYVEATDWSFGGRFFPDLSERELPTKPNASAATSPPKVIALADAEDSLTGFDYLNTHHLETRAGHTFVLERVGEADMALSWADYDEVQGTSTKLKLSCKNQSDCLIENERNGQAVHGRMIR